MCSVQAILRSLEQQRAPLLVLFTSAPPSLSRSRARGRENDELLMNSLKAAFVWGDAGIAQLVEQLICNQQVVGSNPTAGSTFLSLCRRNGGNSECRCAAVENPRCCADADEP